MLGPSHPHKSVFSYRWFSYLEYLPLNRHRRQLNSRHIRKMLSLVAFVAAVPLNQQVATLDHAIALKQIRQEVGFEDSATQQITVHGQPIFRFGKNHENATRLWLPTGVLKTLLTWEATGGKTLSLVGKTFHPKHSNSSRGVKKTDQVPLPTLLHLVAALHPLHPPASCAPGSGLASS